LHTDSFADQERRRRVLVAAKAWISQLIDLGGNNRLLFYRDLKSGTLELTAAKVPVEQSAIDQLISSGRTRLSQLFRGPELTQAAGRSRAIFAKAQENFEERGIETLFLAWGMATWDNTKKGTSIPAAPVVLWPLALVPRTVAKEDFDVSLKGDAVVNPVLLHLLREDFAVDVDGSNLLASGFGESGLEDIHRIFRQLSKEAEEVPEFRIADRTVIGNFSYAKLPMVSDLQTAIDALVDHDLIAAIAGDEGAQEALRELRSDVGPEMPNRTPPSDEFLILDADASQNYAINAAIGGESLIIQGPPGTGKSQTIANLIATYVARGKKVLFVAEKRAAIDAVLKRLNNVGLQDLVMDLHGGVVSRRKMAQDLATALHNIGQIPEPDVAELHRTLSRARDELIAYDEALHRKREPWGLSVFEIQSSLLGFRNVADSSIRFPRTVLEQLVPEVLSDARAVLSEFVKLGGLDLRPELNPWVSSSVNTLEEASVAFELARTSKEAMFQAAKPLRQALDETGLRRPRNVVEWRETLSLLDEVEQLQNELKPEVFSVDLKPLLSAMRPASGGALGATWSRLTSSTYRSARKRLIALCQPRVNLDDKLLFRRANEAFDLAKRWENFSADGGSPRPSSFYSHARSSYVSFDEQLRALGAFVATQEFDEIGVTEAATKLERLLGDKTTLFKLPRLNELRELLTGWGLTNLLERLVGQGLDSMSCVTTLDHAWYASLYEQVALSESRIGAFDAQVHGDRAEEYRSLDREHVLKTAARVRRVAARNAVQARDKYEAENRLLEAQAKRKRGHLPFRELFKATPNLLPALKPCWAMSPLLVSQLLPADKQYFDVAIFDEASQVQPADAIPALLRAKQVVVAGDDRQLPPTSFFASATAEDDGSDEDGTSLVAGFESILDVLGALLRPYTLTWHYRSEDERLIAFSNVFLYDRQLTTFPGIAASGCIEHAFVTNSFRTTDNDSSADEVRKVVQLVLSHAERNPDRSLGVIAMGIKHADRISEAVRRATADRPEIARFFDDRREERFFVKNLERVQGDERDSIILSVGYGKDVDGRLKYRFGPLLLQGGERRLNVAITRARKQMTLVSSFDHTDMDPARSNARGVDLLRQYFPFAASGGNDLGDAAENVPTLNPFEISVRDRLIAAGIPLTAQHGASGYKIDFVAAHPEKPGLFVLAIECDGVSYHSSATARDRDRLRQDVLERLGWKFHRIWSSAWFKNPELEAQRAIMVWRSACIAAESRLSRRPSQASQAWSSEATESEQPTAVPTRGPRPALTRRNSIEQYRKDEIIAVIRWIKSDTLLRTEEQLVEETMKELGFRRKGDKIVAAIRSAIRSA